MLAVLFILHVPAGLSLTTTLGLMAAAAAVGLLRITRRTVGAVSPVRQILIHPGLLLLFLGAGVIALNGGIDYLPYTSDEFTSWIGGSRKIHLYGGYGAVRETVQYPGYTPGWRLLLLLPWQIDGEFMPGQSASAPFVLHVGIAALFFDIVRYETERRVPNMANRATLFAWVVLLLYLAAEGTGKLWARQLLIEQPQIYYYTMIAFLLIVLDGEAGVRRDVLFYVGLAAMGGYLLKAATLTFAPGLGIVILVVFLRRKEILWAPRLRESAVDATCLLLPVLAAIVAWRASMPEIGISCYTSPLSNFSADALARAFALDWIGLLHRYINAVGTFVIGYKTLILLAALVGAMLIVWRRRTIVLLALGAFFFTYFGTLYWYHLTCFPSFYFENLNSIERFTRVALQPFHAVGLLGLTMGTLHLFARERVARYLGGNAFFSALIVSGIVLAGWQAFQVNRSVVDVSTRAYQNVDFRIAEVRRALDFVQENYRTGGRPPRIQFISQGMDSEVMSYAKYYSLGGSHGRPRQIYSFAKQVSWSPTEPTNIWQQKIREEALRREFLEADLIWPTATDPWVSSILLSLVPPGTCPDRLDGSLLIKGTDGTFSCRAKN